jgi:hypothetical protein
MFGEWRKTGGTLLWNKRDVLLTEDHERIKVMAVDIPEILHRPGCGDVKGTAIERLMVHLDLVCSREYREFEIMLIVCLSGARGLCRVYREGEFKVYAVEAA